jgi:metal-responsive CopG/Arc/MetJ family transcriptional regulator
MTKKTQNRVSIFLNDDIRKRLDDFVSTWAQGSQCENRSQVISDLIKTYIPRVIVD